MLKYYHPAGKLTPSNGNPHFHFWKYIINTSTFHDDQLWLGMFFRKENIPFDYDSFAKRRSPQPLQRAGLGQPHLWRLGKCQRSGVTTFGAVLGGKFRSSVAAKVTRLNRKQILHMFTYFPYVLLKHLNKNCRGDCYILLSASGLIWRFLTPSIGTYLPNPVH